MAAQVDTAMQYINSERVEHKIAGIMLLNNILNANPATAEKLVDTVFRSIPVSLVVQMIQTENPKSLSVQLSGLNFLVYSCESKKIAKSVFAYVKELCDVFVNTEHGDLKAQLATFLKLLALVNNDRAKIVVGLLEAAGQVKQTNSLQVLQLVVEIASTPDTNITSSSSSSNSKSSRNPANSKSASRTITLGPSQNALLRSLIVQGVHGAAPQYIRDGTLLCLRDLLSQVPDFPPSLGDMSDVSPDTHMASAHYVISPSYTTHSATTAATATTNTVDPAHATSFPLFLCGILRGELQLLCDELLFLATNSPESVAERFDIVISEKGTVPLNKPVTPPATASDASGEAANTIPDPTAATATATSAENSETPITPIAGDHHAKIDSDIRYFQSRVVRTQSMYLTCLQLVEAVLVLLIGGSDAATGTAEVEVKSVWACLRGEMLLQVKKVLYSLLNDLFEFLIDCSELFVDGSLCSGEEEGNSSSNGSGNAEKSGPTNAFTSASNLRSIACSTLVTMTGFMEQDAELMGVFVKCLPKLVNISYLGSSVVGDVGTGTGIMQKGLLQALLTFSKAEQGIKQYWLESLHYEPTDNKDSNAPTPTLPVAVVPKITTTHFTSATTTTTVHSEILLFLIDPIRTLLYMSENDSLEVNTVEELFDCLPQLLPPVVALLEYALSLVASGSVDDSSSSRNGSSGNSSSSVISADSTNSSSSYHSRDITPLDQQCLAHVSTLLLWLVKDLLIHRESKHPLELHTLMRGEGYPAVKTLLGIEAQVFLDFGTTLRTVSAQLSDTLYKQQQHQSSARGGKGFTTDDRMVVEGEVVEEGGGEVEGDVSAELMVVCMEVADLVDGIFV